MIYIATHKQYQSLNLPNYENIQVGAQLHEPIGYTTDNSGDNISEKNPNYCELTALYWVWKNRADEYVGLVHYRRYFSRGRRTNDIHSIMSEEELKERLINHDIVLAKKTFYNCSARDQLLRSSTTVEVLSILEKNLQKLYPDYLEAYYSFMTGNCCSQYNMFYCKRKILNDYCAWLFPIFFEMERDVDLSTLNNYQKRIYGFLSERLLNIYVMKNNLRVSYASIVDVDLSKRQILTYELRELKNRCIFYFKK